MSLTTVRKNTVVTLRIRLLDTAGELIDEDNEVVYLHGGAEDIFPRVEAALDGCPVGHRIDITLEPDEAFGEYDDELVRIEDLAAIGLPDLEVGKMILMEDPDDEEGGLLPLIVREIDGDKVVLDANHPLVGLTIRFQGEIVAIREATAEEIEHGTTDIEELDEELEED